MICSVTFDDVLANYLQFFAACFRTYWKGSGQEYHNTKQVYNFLETLEAKRFFGLILEIS